MIELPESPAVASARRIMFWSAVAAVVMAVVACALGVPL